MILTRKHLTNDQDILEFIKQYQQVSGHQNTIEQLKSRTCVCAFYTDSGEMCAGFTINSHEPLVYLADLPDCVVEHPLQQLKGEIVEGGGLWVSRDLTDFERGYVFICASWEAYKSNKCYFMSGARNPKVAERQKYIYPNILFEGPTDKFDYVCMLYCKRQYIFVQIALFVSRYWFSQPFKKILRRLTRAPA
ncbi:hypothetical protein [Vibrio sp. NH-UV-68]|uniref:hypothetical protein n=1 Tax=unclassified Vibrio TaxID=2614977 RepID=UPI0036F27643